MAAFDAFDGFAYGIQLAVAGVLFLSAHSKFVAMGQFRETLIGYDLVPSWAVRAVALLVVAAESVVVLALLFGVGGLISISLGFALFASFAAAVGINLRRGRSIACGCFGLTSERISRLTLARLLLLLLAVASLACLDLTGHPLVALAELIDVGSSAAARFVVSTAGLGAFLVLAGMWILALPGLVAAIGIRSPRRRDLLR